MTTCVLLLATAAVASAQSSNPTGDPIRESLDDAWWTGPMLAPSASTLPRGHFLVEPYFYDVIVQGQFDRDGLRQSAPHVNSYGSLTYLLYGVADRFTVGMIPVVGENRGSAQSASSGIGFGDATVQAQYRLTQFHPGSWIPTISVALQESLPTGKYNRLAHPGDGLGSGIYTTTLGFYSQTYFWMPNGRILRMRFNVVPSFSGSAKLDGVSVYGTGAAFRGHARPGRSIFVDAAWEYSLTRNWVLALDATYRYAGNTVVRGYDTTRGNVRNAALIEMNSGSSDAVGLAPAIEYNMTRNLGVLLGVRVIPIGRNTSATVTPAIAVNFVH
jgi:Putative MetA-pathway of phenol degradation